MNIIEQVNELLEGSSEQSKKDHAKVAELTKLAHSYLKWADDIQLHVFPAIAYNYKTYETQRSIDERSIKDAVHGLHDGGKLKAAIESRIEKLQMLLEDSKNVATQIERIEYALEVAKKLKKLTATYFNEDTFPQQGLRKPVNQKVLNSILQD